MSEPSVASPVDRPRKRIDFIDLLRGWAVIVMMETHVVNATLRPDLKAGGIFHILDFLNGLVAPAFLFASGLAYAVTTRRKLRDYLAVRRPLFRQLGRLLMILCVGYLLHLPRFSFHHLVRVAGARAWELFFQVDILHCIAVSLLLLQGLLLLLRTEARLYRTIFVSALLVLLATPFVWTVDFRNILPVFLAAYLNGLHDSLFPVFPWSVFLFAGALTGYAYINARQGAASGGGAGREVIMMRRGSWIALAFVAASFLLDPIAGKLYPSYDYWHVSPSFTLLRLGLVMLVTGGLFLEERTFGVSTRSIVTLFGRESLMVYTAHLILIYGKILPTSFQERVGSSFNYLQAGCATAVLFILMLLLALLWGRVKRGPVRIKRGVELSFVAILLADFFLAPGT